MTDDNDNAVKSPIIKRVTRSVAGQACLCLIGTLLSQLTVIDSSAYKIMLPMSLLIFSCSILVGIQCLGCASKAKKVTVFILMIFSGIQAYDLLVRRLPALFTVNQ